MIDRLTAERIKAAANIVDVVGEYVRLTKSGRSYKGLCPFHNDRRPSFSVDPVRNHCKCFSCGEGGSPVNFLMKKEGISYQDALRRLAARYGIEIQERELTDEERRQQSEREAMFVANEWAMNHMRSNLEQTQEGRTVGLAYFDQRGITDAARKRFNLGYAIDRGGDILVHARKEGYDPEVLSKVGLLAPGKDGSPYEKFHGRVIFPVQNTSGKVVAFGGRDLTGRHPAKYINSPESAIYKKSNELYGFYQARNAIGRCDNCYLVEGYFDVIGLWQAGIENVVASSGTALTDNQIALIHRFTKNVTLIYDGDAAGIKASLRGVDMMLRAGMQVKVVPLPDGDDPDSFSASHTPQEVEEYIKENRTDFIRFKIRVLQADLDDDPIRRRELAQSIVTSIACVPDEIGRTIYIQESARLLNISEAQIGSAVARAVGQLKEDARRERDRDWIRRQEQQRPVTPPPAATTETGAKPATTAAPEPGSLHELRLRRQLESAERVVLTYCARYGMLDFSEAVEETEGYTGTIWLARYVEMDLADDGMAFETQPAFKALFRRIIDLRPAYEEALGREFVAIEQEVNALRTERRDSLAGRNLSMEALEAEEQAMEEEFDEMRGQRVRDFAATFLQRRLLDDEDPAISDLASSLIPERYELSKIYARQRTPQSEMDRLPELIPHAMVVWRTAIIHLQRDKLMRRLAQTDDTAEQKDLMAQIQTLADKLAELAPYMGDRVVSNS